MIDLAAVREMLKPLALAEGTWTIGRYEAEREKRVCVYQNPVYTTATVALGGRPDTKTLYKPCQVLVHWTNNHKETELAALELYEALSFNPRLTSAGHMVAYIDLKDPEPIDMGSDDNGIFERLVRFDIYFEED